MATEPDRELSRRARLIATKAGTTAPVLLSEQPRHLVDSTEGRRNLTPPKFRHAARFFTWAPVG